MLSEAFYVKSNSRLGCQIPITFRRIGTRAGSRKLKKASHVNVTLLIIMLPVAIVNFVLVMLLNSNNQFFVKVIIGIDMMRLQRLNHFDLHCNSFLYSIPRPILLSKAITDISLTSVHFVHRLRKVL
jgi:hypothetical protein